MSIRVLTCTSLTDGRPQLWAMTGTGDVVTSWQIGGTEADPKWVEWQTFTKPAGAVRTLMGAPLLDGRPQLWAVTTEVGVFTICKVNTHPDAAWSNWTKFKVP
ncbi:hypothetical protein ACIP17_31050 [Streptomyces iakyrus]|uniref:hypothetical protein n=1 Tax=Streptomyces iakyrus TaxID=68219 RepID=UPI0038241F21